MLNTVGDREARRLAEIRESALQRFRTAVYRAIEQDGLDWHDLSAVVNEESWHAGNRIVDRALSGE